LLAEAIKNKVARRLGRTIEPLTAADKLRLKNYHWPGNVRELQNVIERAIITARQGRLDLSKILPKTAADSNLDSASESSSNSSILTVSQMKEREKDNIIRALEATNWRVYGKNGAASLLEIPTSTLNSRLKSLGIKRTGR
jgi:transcriptional regulator with GAF, ATPase, and Fis domain